MLGRSLQTPGAQSSLSQKHLFQKPYATACLHVAAPVGHCYSAFGRAQALLFPLSSAAGSGFSIYFAGCPIAGSPSHQTFAKLLAAPTFSRSSLHVCSARGLKPHRIFLLGHDLKTLLAGAAAYPEQHPYENESQCPAVAGLLCQKRAGAPRD